MPVHEVDFKSGTSEPRRGGALDLTNVRIAMRMMEEALEPGAEPGLYVFYGESGWGKTTAVTACCLEYEAVYVAAMEGMTTKSLLQEILFNLGEQKLTGTVVDLTKRAAERLLRTGKALIIDEADFLARKGLLETVRAIHDRSLAPVMLVGEEHLDQRLKTHERFHNRIIGFHAAQRCTIEDARKLARHYASGVTIADDLIIEVVSRTQGVTRRIRTNFVNMRKQAFAHGEKAIDMTWWMDRDIGFFTGEKPERK